MKAEFAVSILVALFLVLTALFDLRVAAWFATAYLIAVTIYKFVLKKRLRRT